MNEEKPLGDKVIETIRSGGVKMRSRRYFILRDILGAVAVVIVLLIAVYFASFIIFVLHANGAWFVPVFGLAGWWSLFRALPWVLISLTVLFNILLAILVKRFSSFGYQWPLIYSLLAIGFLIAAASFIGVQTSVFRTFFASPVARDVRFLGQYYPGIGILEPDDIHRGEIAQAIPNGFFLKDASGNRLTVFVASSTNFPSHTAIRVGDSVVVFGAASPTGTIQAVGIEKLAD